MITNSEMVGCSFSPFLITCHSLTVQRVVGVSRCLCAFVGTLAKGTPTVAKGCGCNPVPVCLCVLVGTLAQEHTHPITKTVIKNSLI